MIVGWSRSAKRSGLLTLGLLAVGAGSAHAAPNPFRGLGEPCATQGSGNAAYAPGINCRYVRHQDYPRRFVVWVPKTAARRMARNQHVPLVVMLHGSSGTGEQFWRMSGWREKAELEGFVAAFPTGLTYDVLPKGGPLFTKWHSYDLPDTINHEVLPRSWPTGATFPADDAGFLRRMIGTIRGKLRINGRRIHLAGFSDGGQMCARVGIEMSDLVASVACHAGFLNDVYPVTPGNPYIPTMLSIGTLDDRLIGKLEQETNRNIPRLPLGPRGIEAVLGRSILARALQSAGLDDQPRRDVVRPKATEMIWSTPLLGNTSGNALHFLMLDRVGHVYPNGTPVRDHDTGQVLNPHKLLMTDRVWPFFRNHPRR